MLLEVKACLRRRVGWRGLVLATVLAVVAAAPASAASPPFRPSPLKHVRANGISIGYRTIGSGPPLVMIMGYSGTLYVWDPALLLRLASATR